MRLQVPDHAATRTTPACPAVSGATAARQVPIPQDPATQHGTTCLTGRWLENEVPIPLMSIVTDDDTPNRPVDGLIGLQVHQGPPMKVEYRNIRLKNW